MNEGLPALRGFVTGMVNLDFKGNAFFYQLTHFLPHDMIFSEMYIVSASSLTNEIFALLLPPLQL